MKIHYTKKGTIVSFMDNTIEFNINLLRVILNKQKEVDRIVQTVSQLVGYECEIYFSCFYNHFSYRNYPNWLCVNTSEKIYFDGELPCLDLKKVQNIIIIPDWDSKSAVNLL